MMKPMLKRTMIAAALALPLAAGNAHAIAPLAAVLVAGATGAALGEAENQRRYDAPYAPVVRYDTPAVVAVQPAPAVVTRDPVTGATFLREPVPYATVTPMPPVVVTAPSITPSVTVEQTGTTSR
jgi:hypothetical protein